MLRKQQQQQRKVDYTATQLLLQRMRIMKEEANPIIIIAITTPASLKPEGKKTKSDRDHMLVISNPKLDDILAANSSQVVYKFFPQS
jgi:hypothetical protein